MAACAWCGHGLTTAGFQSDSEGRNFHTSCYHEMQRFYREEVKLARLRQLANLRAHEAHVLDSMHAF